MIFNKLIITYRFVIINNHLLMYNADNLPIAERVPNITDDNLVIATVIPEIVNLEELPEGTQVITAYGYEIDRRNIDLILSYKRDINQIMACFIIFNMVLYILNPLILPYFTNIILNIYTNKLLKPLLIKTTIIYNAVLCSLIIIVNIVLSVHVAYLSVHILKIIGFVQFIWFYFFVLFSSSFIVITMYMYLIHKFFKIYSLRQYLNNEQVSLLNRILNN